MNADDVVFYSGMSVPLSERVVYQPVCKPPVEVMVFQDGHAYVGDKSNIWATTVMDNFIAGDGGHDHKQAAAIFPDAMRWLWRDWDEGQ